MFTLVIHSEAVDDRFIHFSAKTNGVGTYAPLKATLNAIANGNRNYRLDNHLPWKIETLSS